MTTQKIDAPVTGKQPTVLQQKPVAAPVESQAQRDSSEEIVVAKKRSPLPEPVIENVQTIPGKPKKLGKLPQPQINFTSGAQAQTQIQVPKKVPAKPTDDSDSSISFEAEDRKPKTKIESNKDLDWAVTGPSTVKKQELVKSRPGQAGNMKKIVAQEEDWDS